MPLLACCMPAPISRRDTYSRNNAMIPRIIQSEENTRDRVQIIAIRALAKRMNESADAADDDLHSPLYLTWYSHNAHCSAVTLHASSERIHLSSSMTPVTCPSQYKIHLITGHRYGVVLLPRPGQGATHRRCM